MNLQHSSTWFMQVASDRVIIGNKSYYEDVVIAEGQVTSYSAAQRTESVALWLGSQCIVKGCLFLLVSDDAFDRTHYEQWMGWAHNHYYLFDRFSRAQAVQVLPMILREQPKTRILILASPERQVWPPQEQGWQELCTRGSAV